MCRVAWSIATAFAVGLAFCVAAAAEEEPDGDDLVAPAATTEAPSREIPEFGPISSTSSRDDDAARLLLFAGTDLWHNGGFAHGGFLWAPQGLDENGFVFKLLLNGGLYRYHGGNTEFTGQQLMAAALPGWRFKRGAFELTVFAGLDLQDHRFTPADPGNRLAGSRAGVRAGFDVWYEPLHDGMLTASASFSTIGTGYWTRAAGGWRFFDAVWLGPEVHASGDDIYRQFRFGLHVTSLRMWGYEWSAGAGWVTDSDRRDGIYGRLGVLVRK